MEDRPKLFTPVRVLVGVISTLLVWIFFTIILRPFVPDQNELWTWLLSGFTALSLAGVYFMAYHCFLVVLVDPVARRR